MGKAADGVDDPEPMLCGRGGQIRAGFRMDKGVDNYSLVIFERRRSEKINVKKWEQLRTLISLTLWTRSSTSKIHNTYVVHLLASDANFPSDQC